MTFAEEWEKYKTACYSDPIMPVQEIETRQAFVAGALWVLSEIGDMAQMPEDQAVKRLEALQNEIVVITEQRLRQMGQRQ